MATCTLTDYLPTIAEVPTDRVATVRARLAAFVQSGYPEVDVSPNTPFGDLHLTPLAYQIAALEIAGERMFSDIDLANVAAGTVYNCDYVKEYIQNFAPVPRESTKATGIIRLTFSSDSVQILPRRTLFAFGTGNVFTLRLSGTGDLMILPVGSARNDVNQFVLTQFSRTSFVVDIPVIGLMASQVAAGTTGSVDVTVTNLTGITAVNDFLDGTRNDTITGLAQKTRATFYSSSLTSRGGVSSFVSREFPEIDAQSAVVSGDLEMLRDTNNALGVVNGSLDVYVRSNQAYMTDTQTIKLTYNSTLDKFIGRLELAETPIKIDSIAYNTASSVVLAPVIYTMSRDSRRAPLATAAYSELEQLFIEVPMPRATDGTRLLIVEDGGTVGYFNVTYRFDPAIKQVVTALNSSDVRPIGVDVLAKSFLPVVVNNITVEYAKKSGVVVNVEQARSEIISYFLKLGYPDVYLDSAIGDSMLYAGASGVKRITVNAKLQWSVASKVIPTTTTDLLTNWATVTATARTLPTLQFTHVQDLTPNYRDPVIGTENETLVAAGKRNICYILDSANLNFTELSL